jgi:hypothetical protein
VQPHQPRVSKSRYVAGLQCHKRLWLGWHQPEPRSDDLPGTILAVGTEVGEAAHLLFPGGVLIGEGSREFDAAKDRTQTLVHDLTFSAVFEGAFEHDGAVVRADVIERVAGGGWTLIEVKSSTSAKPEHIDDLAVQTYVLRGAGIDVRSMHLMHVDRFYERGEGQIDWQRYFRRADLTEQVEAELRHLPSRMKERNAVLRLDGAPDVQPAHHCFSPFECEFWKRCTASKPADWVFHLPYLKAATFAALQGAGIERMGLIPSDFPLSPAQRSVADCAASGEPKIAHSISGAIAELGPPSWYLDFTTALQVQFPHHPAGLPTLSAASRCSRSAFHSLAMILRPVTPLDRGDMSQTMGAIITSG